MAGLTDIQNEHITSPKELKDVISYTIFEHTDASNLPHPKQKKSELLSTFPLQGEVQGWY